MRVVRLGPEHDAEATAFLDALGATADGPSVLAYHYPFYRDLLLAALGEQVVPATFAIRGANGEIAALLPGMLRQAEGDACYNSLPFFGPNVGVLAPTADRQLYREWSSRLIREAIDFAHRRHALSATFYSRFAPNESTDRENDPSFDVADAVSIPKETLFLPLDVSASCEWPAKIRYDLRRAEAAGMQVVTEFSPADVDRIVALHEETCRDCGAPVKPPDAIRKLLSDGNEHIGAFGARHEGRLIAALIALWGPQTASYYLPCADGAARGLQPMTLLIDRAIAFARQRGIRYWNFESSPARQGGVWNFKKKWGAVETTYRTTVVRLRPLATLRALGADELSRRFPYFYVYPHSLLA